MHQADDHTRLHDLVPAIIDRLPAILADVRELLVEQEPDYARFLAEEFDEVVAAAEGFIARLVGLAERDPSTMAPQLASGVEQVLFEEIGRIHYVQQRDVTSLLAAYRTGAAVAWRHVADTALQLGVPAEAFAGLAAAVFAAVEQLSSASLQGYVRAQTTAAHARERLRDELAELLLSDRCDTAAVRAAAARAGWPLPRQAAVVLIGADNEVGRTLLDRLDDSCLRLRRGQMLVAIVPDPDGPGRRKRLATALRGAGAVVSATVPLDQLPASVGLAEHAVRLQHILSDDPLFVDEHLDAMVVHRDDRLLAALRQQYLAPLAAVPESTRDRLAETLKSWLMNMGNRKAVADELHVHPQTVRYRLGRLRELFGPALDDPATRAALLLALAWGPAVTESDPLARHTGSR
ncbi:MAG: helix-turn-helix domain-containing protein [Actinomycetota bacterium]|nr:helix-turn-helix domain-containing protein [Actinomycetota bacterium]